MNLKIRQTVIKGETDTGIKDINIIQTLSIDTLLSYVQSLCNV